MAKQPTAADELFWDCATQLFAEPDVHESTMFGFRCIRWRNEFLAMPAQDHLWVKLPAPRVLELLESGAGDECAPNGRRFREWVKIAELDESVWLNLMRESLDFLRTKPKRT